MGDGSSLSQRLKQQDNLYPKIKTEIEKNDVRQDRNSMILSPTDSQGLKKCWTKEVQKA